MGSRCFQYCGVGGLHEVKQQVLECESEPVGVLAPCRDSVGYEVLLVGLMRCSGAGPTRRELLLSTLGLILEVGAALPDQSPFNIAVPPTQSL